MTPDTQPSAEAGTPAAVPAVPASRAPTRRRKRRKRRKSSHLVLAGLVFAFLTLGILSTSYRASDWTENLAESRQFDEADAYWLCKTMFERMSSDPGRAVIPHVSNTGAGGDFHFVWSEGTQFMQLPTHSGLKTAATGSCTVGATQHDVKSLILDGKVIR